MQITRGDGKVAEVKKCGGPFSTEGGKEERRGVNFEKRKQKWRVIM